MQIIRDFEAIDKPKWREFVLTHPNGTIFHTPELFDAFKNSAKYYPNILVAVDDSKNIIGLLLWVVIKEKSGLVGYITARSIVFGGPIYKGNKEIFISLLSSYVRIIGRSVIYSQFRNFFDTTDYLSIYKSLGFNYSDHLNILLNISDGPDYLWNNYSRSRKKGIRKAQTAGFEFIASNDISLIDDFYRLLSVSYARIKLPYPSKDHFLKIYHHLLNGQYQLFMLQYQGQYVASMLALIYKNTLYGYYMGLTNDPEILRLKTSDLFFHKIFEWCFTKEIHTFDWMGAGKPDEEYGVRDFKLQFGGQLVNFGRFTKVHKPIVYNLGKLALMFWQKVKK